MQPDESIEANNRLGEKVQRLQQALMALDQDMAAARKALALSVHELLMEGGGDPSAGSAMDASLDQATSDYLFALHVALDAFTAAASGRS